LNEVKSGAPASGFEKRCGQLEAPLCRRGVKIRVSSTLLRGLGGRIPALGGLRRPPKAGILTASHLKGLISCDNTPERSGSVPAMKKQIPISIPISQFSLANPDIATTVSGSANPANIRNWARWAAEPLDEELLREVQAIFAPVKNLGHKEGLAENN